MNFLIMNIVFLMGIACYAGNNNTVGKPIYSGSDQGGGGHLIVDSSGSLIPLDLYKEPVKGIDVYSNPSKGLNVNLVDVCPSDSIKKIDSENGPKWFVESYRSALQFLDLLKQDKDYKLAEIAFNQSATSIKWSLCAVDLPLIADHRYKDQQTDKEIVQMAIQNNNGEVIFSSPVISRLLKQDNAISVMRYIIIHEIAIRALPLTPRTQISSIIESLEKFYTQGQFDYSLQRMFSARASMEAYFDLKSTVKQNGIIINEAAVPNMDVSVYLEDGSILSSTYTNQFSPISFHRVILFTKKRKTLFLEGFSPKNTEVKKANYNSTIHGALPGFKSNTGIIVEYDFKRAIEKICFENINYSKSYANQSSKNSNSKTVDLRLDVVYGLGKSIGHDKRATLVDLRDVTLEDKNGDGRLDFPHPVCINIDDYFAKN